MWHAFTLLIIGFSVFSAAILLFAYVFFLGEMRKSALGILACTVLLGALTGLQWLHLQFLLTGVELFEMRTYLVLLLAAPPAFYFFSREILLPESTLSPVQALHLIPLVLGFVVPAGLIAPVAFTIGAGYSIWLARVVYGMRRHVRRFRFEMFFFGLFALLAILVLVLVLLIPYISSGVFYVAYANFTGVALILIVAVLIIFPELMSDISDAAKLAYAATTLHNVDIEAKLGRLDRLMSEEKFYQNENLNLAMLAEAMDLTPHQLSELINTHFGHSFSRYVREQRVAEARRLLREDDSASVLAISLATGFRSQSNFYAAFREITGEAPGTFRRNQQQR